MLKHFILILVIITQFLFNHSIQDDVTFSHRNDIPLNFIDEINLINQKIRFDDYLKNHEPIYVEYDNEFLGDTFIKLAMDQYQVNMPNVSQSCMVQLLQFVNALSKKELWALKGIYYFTFIKISKINNKAYL